MANVTYKDKKLADYASLEGDTDEAYFIVTDVSENQIQRIKEFLKLKDFEVEYSVQDKILVVDIRSKARIEELRLRDELQFVVDDHN